MFRNSHNNCKKCEYENHKIWLRTKAGVISEIYSGQKGSSKKRGHIPPEYSKEELTKWLFSQQLFHSIYKIWVDSGYKSRLKPSVDRKCDSSHYHLFNIQLMNWGENYDKSRLDMRIGRLIHGNRPQKAIIQYDRDGNLIANHVSQAEASRVTGVSQGNLNNVLKGKGKTLGGFIWKYA